MNIVGRFLKGMTKEKRATQNEIRQALDSQGFKVLEEDFKNGLKSTYFDLMNISEKDLRAQQMRVRIQIELWKRFYELAGREWSWNGYKDLDELYRNPDESDPIQKRYRELMDEEGETYGTND